MPLIISTFLLIEVFYFTWEELARELRTPTKTPKSIAVLIQSVAAPAAAATANSIEGGVLAIPDMTVSTKPPKAKAASTVLEAQVKIRYGLAAPIAVHKSPNDRQEESHSSIASILPITSLPLIFIPF